MLGAAGVALLEKLFGCSLEGRYLSNSQLPIARALLLDSWARQSTRARKIMSQVKRAREAKEVAREAAKSDDDVSPAERARRVMEWAKMLSAYRNLSEWMSTDLEFLEILDEQAEIKELIESAKTGTGKPATQLLHLRETEVCISAAISPGMSDLEFIFRHLNDPEIVAQLEDDYTDVFMQYEAESDDDRDRSLDGLLDMHGDLGATVFFNKDIAELRTLLGMNSPEVFPFLNSWISDAGVLPADIDGMDKLDVTKKRIGANHWARLRVLRPLWHQYAGLCTMIRLFLSGKNVLLADDVGLGKKMETFMVCATLRHMRLMESRNILPPIGELIYLVLLDHKLIILIVAQTENKWGWNPKQTGVPAGHIMIAVPEFMVNQWEVEARRILDKKYWNVLVYPTVKEMLPEFWNRWDKPVDEGIEAEQTKMLIISHSVSSAVANLALE